MMVTLIGMGTGTPSTITGEGLAALENADLLIGAARLLESMGDSFTHNRAAATRPSEILEIIEQSGASAPCVIYSGDSGFYSGTRGLLTLLHENSVEAKVLAGISSVQYLAARLGRPWQDWTLASAHGVQCDTLAAVCTGKPTFFLTGGTLSASAICKELTAAGLGGLCVTVGENLSYENEAIVSGTAKELSEREFAPLCVLLAEAVFTAIHRGAGIRDDEFIRGAVPMTKQEIRAAILAKLAVTPEDICWDVGAGTGSVSVELALGAKAVYAVEHSHEACELISQNREKFGAWKLHVMQGEAPEALADLPAPQKVFVGGSGGKLSEIMETAARANPHVKICVSAIALETLHTACDVFEKLGYEAEITQLAVSHTKAVGELHMLVAQNPIFLITGDRP